MSRLRTAVRAAVGLLAAATAAASQDSAARAAAAGTAPAAHLLDTVPFAPGERLSYDVTLGGLGVGKASMAITGFDTVQGHRVMHSLFTVKGGIPFFTVNDVLESWFDPHSMVAYRFIQKIHEGGYHPVRIYEFYPERSLYQRQGDTLKASVSDPLDDGSFFYFVRTVPLEVGKTYEFVRYFIPEKNPVIVKVLRRDTITVKAGTFSTIVIQPVIKSGGIFADGGEAHMWLTDDPRHLLVQMKVKTKIPILSSLNLFLRTIEEHADSAK